MALLQRQRVVWSGFPGGPGLSTFYFTDAAARQADLHSLLTSLTANLPTAVKLHIEPGGDIISDTDGRLTGVWAGTLQADVVGTGGNQQYAAPVGFMIRWESLTINAGRRLRGRTFFVPGAFGDFAGDGQMASTVVTQISAAASAFVGAVTPNLLVWQRPRLATVAYVDGKGIPRKGHSARPGSSAVVVTSSVPGKVVVLRSRRD